MIRRALSVHHDSEGTIHSPVVQVQVLLYFIVQDSVDDIIVFVRNASFHFNYKSWLGGSRELEPDTVIQRLI